MFWNILFNSINKLIMKLLFGLISLVLWAVYFDAVTESVDSFFGVVLFTIPPFIAIMWKIIDALSEIFSGD